MMDPQARVEQDLCTLEDLGAPVEPARSQAQFSAGLDVGVLVQWAQALNGFVTSDQCVPVQSSQQVVPALQGVGQGSVCASLAQAVQSLCQHHQAMHDAAMSAGHCVERVGAVVNQCADAISAITTGLQDVTRLIQALAPAPHGECIVQTLLTQAGLAVEGLLQSRNGTLEALCSQAIADAEPAHQDEQCHCSHQSHEAAPVVSHEPPQSPVSVAQAPAQTPCVEMTHAPGVGMTHVAVSVAQAPVVEVSHATGAATCPPLISPQQLVSTVQNHVNMAASVWHQCLSQAADMLCPEAMAESHCPVPEDASPCSHEAPAPDPAPEQKPDRAPEPAPEAKAPCPHEASEQKPEQAPQPVPEAKEPCLDEATEQKPEPAPTLAPTPAPEPAPAPAPAPAPEAVPAASSSSSWAPDIWVDVHANVAVASELSTSATGSAAAASPVELATSGTGGAVGSAATVHLARSEQW
ncbi:hypothetical protein F7230_04005 [Corynebacterium sp. 320]|uniref:hypothetical protein n=1 Tax=Corynebacterium TaxID=1716 RepID=UPI00125CC530|nr:MULTISPECIES: hypothetical protein [Corynebacterium]KAB1504251.1 hypothetical protein F7230_04005 [Corynebacterium sp. 320]KAB1552649.1 hypothetical protein F7233_02585 [Corynebacterium sp. 321]KAB1554133.1 hypothetical protein F7232_04000 [Corynebacterium sp. 319]KAB3528387.1 hypothetical protein F8354_04005 [Corynebacterium sp. 250]KAB3540123.1 hypothetical protein F8390_02330 [Corynebacterium sp. 366]